MSEYVREVNEGNFAQVVCCSPRLRRWWTSGRLGAGRAALLHQSVEAVAEQYAKSARVVKLNVDESPTVTQRYGIQGIPTLILFQEGEEKERIVGVVSREKISRTIEAHISADLN